MAEPHDFEFQLGANRVLKGRGWKGLVALGLLCFAITIGGSLMATPLWKALDYIHK